VTGAREGGGSTAPLAAPTRRISWRVRARMPSIRGAPWMWVAGGGILLSIAVAVGISIRPDLPTAPTMTPQVFGDLHRNVEGGYELRHPEGWEARNEGTATTVRTPNGRAVVAFGVAARGDLQDAERDLVATIRQAYRNVRLTALQAEPIGGRRAVTIAGTGVNDRGVGIRFLAATVGGPGRNYSITMFMAASADRGALMPKLESVLDSFRVTA
jgi:hypothetical protein